jgi:hypothetical protein
MATHNTARGANMTQSMSHPRTILTCVYVPSSMNADGVNQTLIDVLKSYSFIRLQISANKAGDNHCQIDDRYVGKDTEIGGIVTIGLLTLFIWPQRTDDQVFSEISFIVTTNGRKFHKKYQLSGYTKFWLPLIFVGPFQGNTLEKPIRQITDDFFYNELPKAFAE